MTESKLVSRAIIGLRQMADSSFEKMRLIHQPPHRALYSGGAGIAYTFWKAACLLEDPEWLHQARMWIDYVASAPEDDRFMRHPQDPTLVVQINLKDSLFLGNRGVSFVQALIARAEDDQSFLKPALEAFASSESEELAAGELLQGIPGCLVGCALLFRETGEPALKKRGDLWADCLLGTSQASEGKPPWSYNTKLGLAHGRAGCYYALLLWSKETGYHLPEWLYAGLRLYAESGRKKDHGTSWPVDEKDENVYMNSWCNGAPGLILLWTLAHALSGDPIFLQTARASAEYVIHQRHTPIRDLCCGAAGISYALLSLNRIDPEGTWLEQASRYLELAVDGPMDQYHPLALYRGLAGIVCLTLDLDRPEQALFPAVEG